MKLFIYFLASFLPVVGADAPFVEGDGWVRVERPVREELGPNPDPSVWIVFAKQMGDEQFLIRFPDDPAYGPSSDGKGIYYASEGGGALYTLRVEPRPLGALMSLEERLRHIEGRGGEVERVEVEESGLAFDYRLGKKWIQERQIATEDHLYTLSTITQEKGAGDHARYCASFQSFPLEK
jgi:hypothetical protein